MRFVADAMLGTLAKWLRILGYDTIFDVNLDDNQLVRIARAQGRVLLTRDTELARRRNVDVLSIESTQLASQVRQVIRELSLEPDRSFARCPICNQALEALEPSEAAKRVPPYVARTHEHFTHCTVCDRVFWHGTHWQTMDEQLTELSGM